MEVVVCAEMRGFSSFRRLIFLCFVLFEYGTLWDSGVSNFGFPAFSQ